MAVDDRRLVFAGAGPPGMGTPWGTVAELTALALVPRGYEVHVEGGSFGPNNPRYVADGRADLGATNLARVLAAYHGRWEYAGEVPRTNLRVIAAINHPSWIGVAVKAESDIVDLGDIASRRLPVRVKSGAGPMFELAYQHYSLSRKLIGSWGGRFHEFTPGADVLPWVREGDFDLILDTIYAAYTPEVRHWHEASILHDLRFVPLPDALVTRICAEVGGEPSSIPRHLVRGVTGGVASVARLPQVVYGRDDTSDELALTVARALDDNRHLFRSTHIPYSYDPRTVARTHGAPIHPAAAAYYRDAGYL